MTRLTVAAILTAIVGCSDDVQQHQDAAVIGDGVCGTDLEFTGEFVDWTSNDSNAFCGIYKATWQVHGDSSRTDQSNPNGRFDLCLKPADQTQVDITVPTGPSECVQGAYTKQGIAIANRAVIAAGALMSARSITDVELQQMSLNLDTSKGYVFVHVVGAQRAVSLSSTHDAPLTFDGNSWVAGDTGANVFFVNTDPGTGSTTLQVDGGAIGTGSIPVVANTFTYVTVAAN
jgi:hypothetical protein